MNGRPNRPLLQRRRWPQALTIVLLAMLAWLTAWLVIRLA